jgi:uncharacterized protein (DUF3084 family)
MEGEHPQSIEEQLREARARADKEKARADKEKARADKEEARADKEEARADKEEARADKEEARADKEEARRAREAKNNITTYALFVLQRQCIMRNSTGSCRSCSAWNKSHLDDHGY